MIIIVRLLFFFIGINGLCVLLKRLAYPNRLVDLEPIFGYSYRSLSSIANKIMEIIILNKGHLLQHLGANPWLNENKLRQYANVSRKFQRI